MNVIRFQSSYAEPYPLQVVGEESYRDELEDVSGYLGEDEGVNADDFIAQLVLEDKNLFDPGNAVAVRIDGKTVGYLSKGNAKKYRARLAQLGLSDVVGECFASIRGGFIKRSGDQADFGVRLDLDLVTFEPLKPRPVETAPQVATTAAAPVKPQLAASPVAIAPTSKTPVAKPPKKKASLLNILVSIILISSVCLLLLLVLGSFLSKLG